jgi:thiol-disulfide isomerase/thioredoxin/sulfite exporter TauE/SafE
VTFTVAVAVLARLATGGVTRNVSIGVLAAAGVLLLIPPLAARVEAATSRVARLGPRTRGDGFASGLLVGAAFGFVYFPCAGPILAAVIAVGSATGKTILIGGAYALGTALTLLAITIAGRRLLAPLRSGNRMRSLQRATGALLVATAVVLAAGWDIALTNSIARNIPDFNLASGLEKSHAVRSRLVDLRGQSRFAVGHEAAAHGNPRASKLQDYGPAPDFTGNQRWFNTPGGRPLTLRGLRGHVVLIDFWTYTCINCIRTLPYLKAWYAKYHRAGLEIVGVHSPEFQFEKDAGNVAQAIHDDGLRYPVVQDNDLKTWDAWTNQAWPAEYLVDARGHVRHYQIGEGDYAGSERAIRSLLAEAGAAKLGAMTHPRGVIVPTRATTPETYVGTARAERFAGKPQFGTRAYSPVAPAKLAVSHFSLGGIWTIGPQAARAKLGATLAGKIHARDVYVVLSPPPGGPGRVQVSIDSRTPRTIVVDKQRLYTLAHFASDQTHLLTLRPQPGVAAYSFTFG